MEATVKGHRGLLFGQDRKDPNTLAIPMADADEDGADTSPKNQADNVDETVKKDDISAEGEGGEMVDVADA